MTRQREAVLFFLVLWLVLGLFLCACSVVVAYLSEWGEGQLFLALRLDVLSAAAVAAYQAVQAYRRGSP